MTRIPTKLKPWFEARRRFKLSHAHTQMARELGMNPRKLGSLADGGQEPWKLPLPEFIVACYRKSFGRSEPEHVRSLEEVVQAEERRRKEKQTRKAGEMVIPAGSAQSAVPADGVASASRRQIRSRTLALARDTRTMRFHANHVSSSISGDYYQVMFEAEEDTNDPDSPYLLIQRLDQKIRAIRIVRILLGLEHDLVVVARDRTGYVVRVKPHGSRIAR